MTTPKQHTPPPADLRARIGQAVADGAYCGHCDGTCGDCAPIVAEVLAALDAPEPAPGLTEAERHEVLNGHRETPAQSERDRIAVAVERIKAAAYAAGRASRDPEPWPCDNHRAPSTCLTAPSAEGSECDHCRRQIEGPAVARLVADAFRSGRNADLS